MKRKPKSQHARAEEVLTVAKEWAYDMGDSWLISFWEMADNLNNRWAAPLFVSEKYRSKEYDGDRHWCVADYNFDKFRRAVNWTVRRIKGAKIIKQHYGNEFYLIPKQGQRK